MMAPQVWRMALVLLLIVPGTGTSARAATLERVGETQTFRIGYRHLTPPYSFTVANGQPAGYMVDLCREVAAEVQRHLNLPRLNIEYVALSADDRLTAVEDGRVDILCGPTSLTLSRQASMDFSFPTFIDGIGVATRGTALKKLEDLAGRKVGVLKGTTTVETVRAALAQTRMKAEIITVDDYPQGLKMLEDGTLDAYFGDRGILAFLITNRAAPVPIRLSEQYFSFETYALALPRGDRDFRLLVDATLAELYRSERIRKIYARTFGKFPPDQFMNALFVIHGVPK